MAGIDILHAQTMTPKILVSKFLTATDAAAFIVPAGSSAKISTGVLCNTSTTTSVLVYVSVVGSPWLIGAQSRIIHGYSLAAGDSLSLTPYIGGTMMTDSDYVAAYASTANLVTLTLSGIVQA